MSTACISTRICRYQKYMIILRGIPKTVMPIPLQTLIRGSSTGIQRDDSQQEKAQQRINEENN